MMCMRTYIRRQTMAPTTEMHRAWVTMLAVHTVLTGLLKFGVTPSGGGIPPSTMAKMLERREKDTVTVVKKDRSSTFPGSLSAFRLL